MGKILGSLLTLVVLMLAPSVQASEIEDLFVREVKATFSPAPTTAPGRERRMGRSADGLYIIELIGHPNPHTVTMIVGINKANLEDVTDVMAQAAFIFLDWEAPRPWLEKAIRAAILEKKTVAKGPSGSTMTMNTMEPLPAVSLVLAKGRQ